MKNASLTIVVPFCDEETDVITENLGIIHRYAQMLSLDYEIIVIKDGGKIDFLHRTLETPNTRYMSNPVHRGKGFVIRQGVLSSRGEIVCFLDGDLAISPDHLVPYIQVIQGGADVAIASRAVKGTTYRYPTPLLRKIMSFVFTALRKAVVGIPHLKDTQCGFKVFRGELARRLFAKSRINGFCFDVEILLLASLENARIRELPVTLNNHPRVQLNLIADALAMTIDLFRIKINYSFKQYET